MDWNSIRNSQGGDLGGNVEGPTVLMLLCVHVASMSLKMSVQSVMGMCFLVDHSREHWSPVGHGQGATGD